MSSKENTQQMQRGKKKAIKQIVNVLKQKHRQYAQTAKSGNPYYVGKVAVFEKAIEVTKHIK